MKGASLTVASGGACIAKGVIFTHIADDTVGGDTLFDGDATKPVTDAYKITGNVTDDDETEYRYTMSVVSSWTISSNTKWRGHKVYKVTCNLFVASGATLTILPGTVVKFCAGTSLTVASGGACIAKGVIFTHIADDTVGGDTLFDGDATKPVTGAYWIGGNVIDDDATEYRYIAPVAMGGTISANTRLRGNKVYKVTGNLTVASGATLTIQPGTIVKFASGVSLTVASGATLDAQGTRAAPIVFTSLKDDDWGGDTNGDGDATYAQPGDWKYVYVNGTANLKYCHGYYGAPSNETGIFEARGQLTMEGCTVAHSLYDGVWNWGGTIVAKNCVFFDCGNAVCPYRGSTTCDNCVMAACNYGFMDWSHWVGGTFRNCIFYGCGKGWSDTNSSETQFQGHSKVEHCCFYNPDGYALRSCVKAGVDGCIYADPLFEDPDNYDFRIAADSPCVDAADTESAPAEDFYGQPRLTVRENAAGTAQGQLADIGICEVMLRGVASDIDLEARSIRGETNAVPGQLLFVKWEVANVGGAEVDEPWRDTISLVSADGSQEVSLGDKTTVSAIAVGGTVFCSAYFTVPAMAEGTWRPKVNVNSYHDVFEGMLTTNNVLVGSGTVTVATKPIEAVANFDGIITGGSPKILKLAFDDSNSNRMVRLALPAGVSVRWGFGFMPSASMSSGAATSVGGDVLFKVPEDATTVYVSLESDDNATFEMSFEDGQVMITGVSPNTLPSSGSVTITIDGAGFTSDSKVNLVGGTTQIAPESVQYVSAEQLVATVDCGKLKAGAQYDIAVIGSENTATAPAAVSVAKVKGEGKIVASLILPSSFRQGREVSGYIEYSNVGNADAPLPIFVISSCGNASLVFRLPFENSFSRDRISVIGLGDYKGFGLAPGTVHRIPFIVKSVSLGTVEVEISEIPSQMQESVDNVRTFLSCVAPKVNHSERFHNVLQDYSEYVAGEVNYVSGFISRMTAGSNEGVEVAAYVHGDNGWICIGTGTCNAYGGYSIPVETNGTCRVLCSEIGYVSDEFILESNRVERVDIANVMSRRMTVSTAVQDAGCELVCVNDEYSIERRVSLLSGSVSVDSLLPLKWHVWIASSEGDVLSEQKEVDLSDGNGVVVLNPLGTHSLRVKVMDVAGGYVDACNVSIIGDSGEISGLTHDGIVEFKGLVRRECVVVVTDDDYVDTYTCISGDNDEVEIVLDSGFLIEGTAETEGTEGTNFVLITGNEYSTVAQLDINGHYRVKVPSGEYSIQSLQGDVLKSGVRVGNAVLKALRMGVSTNASQDGSEDVSEQVLAAYERDAILDGLGLKALYEWRYTLWSKEKRSPAWLLRAFIGPFGKNTGHHVGTQHFGNESYYADLARDNTSCSNPYCKVRDAFTELIKQKMTNAQNPLQCFYGVTSKRRYCANFGSFGNIFNPLWGAFRGTYRTK